MKKVEIYTTTNCHFCHAAKEYFKEHNIAYVEYDVSTDTAKREEMIDITGQMGVPVIRIENDVMVGFNKPMVMELLGTPA